VHGFSARFFQTSTLQAMKITDSANGQAYFKKPGMMKWEYIKPDRQQIITDGSTLWIYRPDDRQVTVGEFPSFFGGGKGAGFLSDIGMIREKFLVALGDSRIENERMLKLWPKKKDIDLLVIHVFVSRETCDILRLVTYNSYGDETRIEFTDINFSNIQPAESFHFDIPPGTDVIQYDR
jgi:outer membrane lipoprotein carrier protein